MSTVWTAAKQGQGMTGEISHLKQGTRDVMSCGVTRRRGYYKWREAYISPAHEQVPSHAERGGFGAGFSGY